MMPVSLFLLFNQPSLIWTSPFDFTYLLCSICRSAAFKNKKYSSHRRVWRIDRCVEKRVAKYKERVEDEKAETSVAEEVVGGEDSVGEAEHIP